MRVLAVIPARAGSKGVPAKNEVPLAGKTLIERCRDAAHASGVVDRLIVSTESERIAALARDLDLEVPFLRPPDLASDEAPMQPVIEHAVRALEARGYRADAVAILQPTSPLRTGEHIRRAVALLEESGGSAVVSVARIPSHLAPQYAMRVADDRLEPYLPEGRTVTRRQDVEPAYYRDGSIYLTRRDVVIDDHDLYGKDPRALTLPPEDVLTIDSPEDWEAAERVLAQSR